MSVAEKENSSIYNFNFIYYIINCKSSDIVIGTHVGTHEEHVYYLYSSFGLLIYNDYYNIIYGHWW